jgi:hypothetical protein
MLCVFGAIDVTLAWLKYRRDVDNTTTPSSIGFVDFEIYKANTKINGTNGVYTIQCDSSGFYRSSHISIRNVGNISALLRFEMSIYYMDGTNKCNLQSNHVDSIGLNSEMVDVYAGNDVVTIYSGAVYYNNIIQPYNINGVNVADNIVSILTDFNMVAGFSANVETFYVDITNVSMIAYTGNIYKKIYQYTRPGEDWSEEGVLDTIFGRMLDAEMPTAGKNAFAYGKIYDLPDEFIAYR